MWQETTLVWYNLTWRLCGVGGSAISMAPLPPTLQASSLEISQIGGEWMI